MAKSSDNVVIVADRSTYPEYLVRSAYICQAERVFRDSLTHMGFYTNGAIQTHVPHIWYREDLVTFTYDHAAARQTGFETDQLIRKLINAHLTDGTRDHGKQYQVFLLSQLNHPDTVLLDQRIRNDTTTGSGRPWPWTIKQRYVSLAALTRPGVTVTSDLASQ
ncbi:MAG: hypothetical protein LC644_11925 [Pseudonocardia sp.]|nr:hypothetical protein [Pseudonocardia sp.]